MTRQVRVAVFRPDDERLAGAVELLESLGATPVPDPMLAVESTGNTPEAASYVVLTSKTGAELLSEAGWDPDGATLVCIGPSTADAARAAGWRVDRVPEEYSSAGLVDLLEHEVGGERVAVARSDHGSDVLLDGLRGAGADVHETVLYRLTRPPGSGQSTVMAAGHELEGACFSSSLTVENFLAAAAERGVRDEAVAGLNEAVVGAIGEPTRSTAELHGIDVDIIPDRATFDALVCLVVEAAAPTHYD
jgi:uroporphyrinogen-III synthase